MLDSLSENVGELLKPVGSAFQETFINIVEFIDMAIGRLKLFLELGATGTKKKVDRLSADITRLLKKEEEFNRRDRAAGRSRSQYRANACPRSRLMMFPRCYLEFGVCLRATVYERSCINNRRVNMIQKLASQAGMKFASPAGWCEIGSRVGLILN